MWQPGGSLWLILNIILFARCVCEMNQLCEKASMSAWALTVRCLRHFHRKGRSYLSQTLRMAGPQRPEKQQWGDNTPLELNCWSPVPELLQFIKYLFFAFQQVPGPVLDTGWSEFTKALGHRLEDIWGIRSGQKQGRRLWSRNRSSPWAPLNR